MTDNLLGHTLRFRVCESHKILKQFKWIVSGYLNSSSDHFMAAAVEHRFESPKTKAGRLVEFDCRGHRTVRFTTASTSAGPFQEFVFQPIGFA